MVQISVMKYVTQHSRTLCTDKINATKVENKTTQLFSCMQITVISSKSKNMH